MISFEEALRLILDETPVMHTKRVKLERLLGRVLAEPVVTPTDLPSFDNSAVDGFGIKLNDISAASQSHPRKLPLSATIQAGDSGDSELIAGNAFKILTGAPVPPSVEAVVMREYCREEYGSVIVETSAKEGENIRRRGAEFLRGQQILPTASLATPPVIGMLATLGYPSFPVYEQPSVAIMYTGNELIRPGKPLAHGQIYNSNSYALTAALESFGCTDLKVFHAKDTPASTKRALKSALSFADVIISTTTTSKTLLNKCASRQFSGRSPLNRANPFTSAFPPTPRTKNSSSDCPAIQSRHWSLTINSSNRPCPK
jgi:molybdopterin molybdotransferase